MTNIDKIKELLDSGAYTQTQIAKEIGFSGGALSAYLKGNYRGDNDKLNQSLNDWLDGKNRQQEQFMSAPAFIETATAKQVMERLDFAKMFSKITVIHGASGLGKTKSARHYSQTHNNVWMITASPSCSTLNEILYEMALELGLNDAPKRAGKLSRVLKRKLMGSKGLMIIDEADHLPYNALEEIRILQESTEIGFALIGNDKVYTRMQGGANQHHEFARLWSRIATKLSLPTVKKADIKAIATAWGLDLTDTQLMKALYEMGKSAGALRALTNYLELAGMSARANNSGITLKLILAAQQQMEGKQ